MSDYKGTFKPGADNNNWNLAFSLIHDSSSVIDIGCSKGSFGLALKESKKCSVDGIEPDKGDYLKAKKVLDNVYNDTVETLIEAQLNGKKYDTATFLDVIEHLQNPVDTLRKIKKILKKSGNIVFSIPNMGHVSVRLMLLQGDFEYGKTGILDNTHLHYYTEREINRVFNEAGYEIKHLKAMTVGYNEKILKNKLREIGIKNPNKGLIEVLGSNNSHVYQFVGLAKPVSKPKYSSLERKFQSPEAKRLFEEEFNQKLATIKVAQETVLRNTKLELSKVNNELNQTTNELRSIQNSYSFRLGRFLLYIPSQIKILFKKIKPTDKNKK